MINYKSLRIDSVLLLDDKPIQVSAVYPTGVGLKSKDVPDIDTIRTLSARDLKPVELNQFVIEDKLHFVLYERPFRKSNAKNEFTDGRIILRVNENNVSVFQPNGLPWANKLNIFSDFVCIVRHLHHLQNVYFDLFEVDLDVEGIL